MPEKRSLGSLEEGQWSHLDLVAPNIPNEGSQINLSVAGVSDFPKGLSADNFWSIDVLKDQNNYFGFGVNEQLIRFHHDGLTAFALDPGGNAWFGGDVQGGVGGRVVKQASMRCSDGALMRNQGFSSCIRNSAGCYSLTWANAESVDSTNQYTVVLTKVWVAPYEGDTIVYGGPSTSYERTSTSFTIYNVNDNALLADSEAILIAIIV